MAIVISGGRMNLDNSEEYDNKYSNSYNYSNLNSKSLISMHNLGDKLMKQISKKEINILLERLGIPIKIAKRINGELIFGNIERRTDFLGLTENDELINIEFQSTSVNEDDIERFGEYTSLIRIIEKKYTYPIVISTPQLNPCVDFDYFINEFTVLKIKVFTLKDENGDEVQKKLLNKIENKEEFDEKDIIDFVLSPLMSSKRRIEDVIQVNVNAIRKIKTCRKNIDFIESMTILEVNQFVNDEDERNFLRREINMRINLLREIYEDNLNEGIAIGEERGIAIGEERAEFNVKQELALKLLNDDFEISYVSDLTGLTKSQILEIKDKNSA